MPDIDTSRPTQYLRFTAVPKNSQGYRRVVNIVTKYSTNPRQAREIVRLGRVRASKQLSQLTVVLPPGSFGKDRQLSADLRLLDRFLDTHSFVMPRQRTTDARPETNHFFTRLEEMEQATVSGPEAVGVFEENNAAGMTFVLPDRDKFIEATHLVGPQQWFTSGRLMSITISFNGDNQALLESTSRGLRDLGAIAVPDYSHKLDDDDELPFDDDDGDHRPEDDPQSLAAVMRTINAQAVWERLAEGSTEEVILAIVDTGIWGTRAEFADVRRGTGYAPRAGVNPWEDRHGHGTMVSCIAAGRSHEFHGVNPWATLYPCRTDSFRSAELADILDHLASMARDGDHRRVVANCSWGRDSGPGGSDTVISASIARAVEAGVAVCFSAGNYNENPVLGGDTDSCEDRNSIWTYKSNPDVFVTAGCDENLKMWSYSSRGPGQNYQPGDPVEGRKPDVVAPTPKNGRIPKDNGEVRVGRRGWGTSGSSPQAAALCAARWSIKPGATASELFDTIRSCSQDIGHGTDCQGHGLIDCEGVLSAP